MIFKILNAKDPSIVIEGHLCPPKYLYKNIHSSTIQTIQISIVDCISKVHSESSNHEILYRNFKSKLQMHVSYNVMKSHKYNVAECTFQRQLLHYLPSLMLF